MTAREYLEQIEGLKKELEEYEHRMDYLRAKAEGVASPQVTDMPRGGGTYDMTHYAIALAEVETQYNAIWDEYINLRRRVIKQISRIKDPAMEKLLSCRYLWFMPWKDIAEAIDYSEDHARGYLFKKALHEFARKNPKIKQIPGKFSRKKLTHTN